MNGQITLRRIMLFATGMEEEPLLGWDREVKPSIRFVRGPDCGWPPSSPVCINQIKLKVAEPNPDPKLNVELPSKDDHFDKFDMGFLETDVFGQI